MAPKHVQLQISIQANITVDYYDHIWLVVVL